MRRILCAVTVLAFVATLGAPLFAATKTVKGEIIDVQCYTKRGVEKGSGEAHKNCGTTCAKKGAPLAILATEDGKPVIYTITGDYTANNNEKLVPHFAHLVEVTGDVTEKDGAKQIEVKTLKMQKTEKTS